MGGIVSGVLGARSARRAADAQVNAANSQIAAAERQEARAVERFEPYAQSGLNFQNALNFELLGGNRPTFQGQDGADFEYGGFQNTPGFKYALDQGLSAVENSAAARGSLNSGATLKSLQATGQGLQNQEWNNYINRLTTGAAGGQSAAALQANAGANATQQVTNALGNIGNAQAAGAIGAGNALQGGLNNQIGLWNYQNQQSNQGGVATGLGGLASLFGGGFGLT